MQSLILLSSLRPRLSGIDGEHAPLIPPPSVLRTLHSILPLSPSQGWQGTLDETRKAALRDDTTVRVEGGVTPVAQQPATTVPPAVPAYPPSPLYASNVQYRSTPATYAYLPQSQPRQSTQTPVIAQSNYYQNTYQSTGAPQYQYYSQWYNYQTVVGQKGAPPTGYYGNYANTATPRPVGNTAKPQQPQQNGWTQGYIQSPATVLPPHLRRAAAPTTPGTPTYSPYQPYIPTQPTR